MVKCVWLRAPENFLGKLAKDELGYENRKKPDWFRESEKDLKTLNAERNRLYALWISTRLERDRKKHVRARRLARQAIRDAKNTWFQHKALEAERGRHDGKIVWRCIGISSEE